MNKLFISIVIALLGFSPAFAAKVKETKKTTQRPVVLFMGDSLTEGYGVNKKKAYPSLVVEKLKKQGHPVKLVNGSISGSTSASSVSRLKWFLKAKPSLLFLALGANDALRGVSVKETKKNLGAALAFAREHNITVLLAAMKAPPNYGKVYTKGFHALYPELAKQYKVKLVPFLLENVAGEKSLNQNDGIHPNEKGHKKIAEHVYPYLLKSIKSL